MADANIINNQNISVNIGGSTQSGTKTVNEANDALATNSKQLDRNTQSHQKNRKGIHDSSNAMNAFLGVGLGVLFLSQQIGAAFNRMITPVFEVTGLFDVWKATLISVLGPVLIPLSGILINMLSWFMNLPTPVKVVIGVFVLFVSVLTSMLVFGAQVALLIVSLAQIGGIGASITTVTAALKALTAGVFMTKLMMVGAIFAKISLVIFGVYLAITLLIKGLDKITEKFSEGGFFNRLMGFISGTTIGNMVMPGMGMVLPSLVSAADNYFPKVSGQDNLSFSESIQAQGGFKQAIGNSFNFFVTGKFDEQAARQVEQRVTEKLRNQERNT